MKMVILNVDKTPCVDVAWVAMKGIIPMRIIVNGVTLGTISIVIE